MYDSNGFDRNGINQYTHDKYDDNGFDRYGLNKDTKTMYDSNGFDSYGNKKKVKLKLVKQNLLKIEKEKDMSIYLLLYLKYILIIIVQKNS